MRSEDISWRLGAQASQGPYKKSSQIFTLSPPIFPYNRNQILRQKKKSKAMTECRMSFSPMRNVLLRALTLKSKPPPPPPPPVFSSLSKLSPPPTHPLSSPTAGAVAELADDYDEGIDRLHTPPVTAFKPVVLPDLLQPRVVVFDGVCRLCHTGTLSLIVHLFFCILLMYLSWKFHEFFDFSINVEFNHYSI